MVLMPSSELNLTPKERNLLLDLAWETIRYGARHLCLIPVDWENLPAALKIPRASFVTLERYNSLRGCIGSLVPHRMLAEDVIANAFAAAFADPRFPPVALEEIENLNLHLSILSPLREIPCRSEEELLAQLRPGTDGLVLEEGQRRGTFLPSVWASLPEKKDFLAQLKIKAGFPPNYWSPRIKAYRYTTEVIS
jgi:AmmeMemoRadiSam system protein A